MPLVATRSNASSSAYGQFGGIQKLPYQWVRVGQSGGLYTSTNTNGSSWTSRTSSFSTSDINGVASNGKDLYVAVGLSAKLATSPDGVTWTQRTSSFGASDIRMVAYGTDTWVAVGTSGKIATSTDGVTWEQRTSPVTDILDWVEYGNGAWVASTTNGKIISTGSDPTTGWTLRTDPFDNASFVTVHYSVGAGIWVAGYDDGTTGSMASSTDGITWTARDGALNRTVNRRSPFDSNSSIISEAGGAVGNSQSSANGTTWTSRAYATEQFPCAGFAIASDDAGRFLYGLYDELNNDFIIQSSNDAINFTSQGVVTGTSYCFCHSSGKPGIR